MKKEFICEKCGFCCKGESTVSLQNDNINEISIYLGIDIESLFNNFLIQKKSRIEMKTRDGFCIFFDNNNKICLIHPVKPEHCRIWPLHKSILNDEESFNIIKNTCPALSNMEYNEICEIIGEKNDIG